MRGIPNNPVACEVCGKPGFPSLRRCNSHRPPNPRKRFFFTPEMDVEVRDVWTKFATDKFALTAGIDRLVKKYPTFPRYIFKNRAQQLGVTFDTRHHWTEAEKRFLRDNAGEMTIKEMAKALGHGFQKVASQMEYMKVSARVSHDGYTMEDFCNCIGVAHQTVLKWEKQRIVSRYAGRFSENTVRHFIRNHPDKYDLRRVDQTWFKGLLFDSAGCFTPKPTKAKMLQEALEHRVVEMSGALA